MYVAAYVTSTLLQSLVFAWPDESIVHTVTLFAVCVIYGYNTEIVFSSVIAYVTHMLKALHLFCHDAEPISSSFLL
jgi:hypothetical protein